MTEESKIVAINHVVKTYFENHLYEQVVPAKDLMPQFIAAGVFIADSKGGKPIRELIRKLDTKKQLHLIPYVIPERKTQNTNWFFVRPGKVRAPKRKLVRKRIATAPTKWSRKDSDEHYVIDLCDEVLKLKGSRQHRFDFLRGDANTKLPIDVYYPRLNLVIEFAEVQHTKPVKHFDKPNVMTVSGVHRGIQRRIYDERKKEVLPRHRIKLIEIPFHLFNCTSRDKIIRNPKTDLKIIRQFLTSNMVT